MRTIDDVKPDELRRRAYDARQAIESGDPERIRQAQLDLEALAAEAEAVQTAAEKAQDERDARIIEGRGIVGWFAEAVGVIITIGSVVAFITGIVWSFNNGVSWVWEPGMCQLHELGRRGRRLLRPLQRHICCHATCRRARRAGCEEQTAAKVGTVAYSTQAGFPNGSRNQPMGYGRIDVGTAAETAGPMFVDQFNQLFN